MYMKKLTTIFALLLSVGVFGQSDRYMAAMRRNLAQFDSAKTTADFQSLAASFERIGDAEKNQWLPYYYAGLALSIPAWTDDKLDKDVNAQKMLALCDKADAIEKTSDIFEIRNMAATQQMTVDPQNRWTSFGQQASQAIQKGIELNPSNPRLYYLQGQSVFNTPEQFGGGKTKAKPIFEKAVALFKSESTKPLHPQWGKKEAEEMLARCQ
jgi:hypothetical protein